MRCAKLKIVGTVGIVGVVSESRCLPRSIEAPFLKVVRTNNGQFGGFELVTPQVSQPLAY